MAESKGRLPRRNEDSHPNQQRCSAESGRVDHKVALLFERHFFSSGASDSIGAGKDILHALDAAGIPNVFHP
jgi:hypothetical protein